MSKKDELLEDDMAINRTPSMSYVGSYLSLENLAEQIKYGEYGHYTPYNIWLTQCNKTDEKRIIKRIVKDTRKKINQLNLVIIEENYKVIPNLLAIGNVLQLYFKITKEKEIEGEK